MSTDSIKPLSASKMDPAIKPLWVTALRSGQYHQAQDEFTGLELDAQGEPVQQHCCLAVLTDIAIEQGVVGLREVERIAGSNPNGGDRTYVDYEYATWAGSGDPIMTEAEFKDARATDALEWNDNEGDLPPQVREWAGLDQSNPVIGNATAIVLNDERKATFEEIAKAVEENL